MKKSLCSFILSCLIFPLFCETITFKADSLTGTAGSTSDTTRMKGNAFVKTSSMEISAESIELSGDDYRFILADGNVTGKNLESKMEFTCGKMHYDRQTKIAYLEDAVHLVDTANEVTADAQIIDYNQNTEIAVMQIGITLKQKDNTCTAAYAVYRKNDKILEMSGNPKIIQGVDTFRAQEITLNLDSQEITLDGRVSGTVTDSKKEVEKPSAKDSEKKPDSKNAGEKSGEEKGPEEKADKADKNTDQADTGKSPDKNTPPPEEKSGEKK